MGECTLCSSNLTQHVPLRALIIFGAFLAVGTVYYDSQGCDKIVMSVLVFLLGFFLAFWALFLGNIIKRSITNVRHQSHVVDSGLTCPSQITSITKLTFTM